MPATKVTSKSATRQDHFAKVASPPSGQQGQASLPCRPLSSCKPDSQVQEDTLRPAFAEPALPNRWGTRGQARLARSAKPDPQACHTNEIAVPEKYLAAGERAW